MNGSNGNVFNYTAEGAIPARRIAKYGTANDSRALATAATALAGITTDVGESESGRRVDVQEDGECQLQLGQSVAAGDWLTSDSQGRGIIASPVDEVIARAKESGTENEIIRVNITRFVRA